MTNLKDVPMYAFCDNCKNQNTEHCEKHNQLKYGYCGNWQEDEKGGAERNDKD